MPANDPREVGLGRPVPRILDRLEAFDVVTERAAISILKLAGWVATIVGTFYALWKAF
jgi:hypothetical protein